MSPRPRLVHSHDREIICFLAILVVLIYSPLLSPISLLFDICLFVYVYIYFLNPHLLQSLYEQKTNYEGRVGFYL